MSERNGILARIKDLLGLSKPSRPESTDDADITVEREPDTASEDAVKGTETVDTEADETRADESDETESEGADETEIDAAVETEPGEATEIETGDADEPTAEEPADGSEDSVEEINGIGPTYADRIAGIGIETVGDLAAAEAAEVAEAAQAAESRASTWIENAQNYE